MTTMTATDTLHVTVNRKAFAESFARAAKIAPTASPKTILLSVKLVVDDDTATLMATDLEVGARIRVHGVAAHSPGSAIISAAKMSQILSKSNDAELDIRLEDDKLIIRGQRSRFVLPTDDPSLYPDVPSFTADAWHVVACGDFRKLIRRTITSTDLLSTRYALGGCLIELSDDSVSMVGTDGRRLAKMTTPAEAENGATSPGGSPVISVKCLKAIDSALDDPDLSVHVAFVGNSAVLVRTSDESSVIYGRLVEGRYPRYQDAVLSNPEVRIPLDAKSLRIAVEQASIVTSEESRAVTFLFADHMLTLTSQAADVGSSTISMPTDHDGMDVTIDFDPRYVLDGLKTIDDGEIVTFEAIDEKNAANFVTTDGYSMTIMPLTRNR